MRSTNAEDLSKERDVLSLLAFVLEIDPTSHDDAVRLADDDRVFGCVLANALTEMRTQGAESVALHREPLLLWDELISVIGSESALEDRLARWNYTTDTVDRRSLEAAELAKRYLAGWRPEPRYDIRRPLPHRPAPNSPVTFFQPELQGSWPDLVIRAIASFRPARDAELLEIPGREFHTGLEAILNKSTLVVRLTEIAATRATINAGITWEPDRRLHSQSRRSAVSYLRVTADDSSTGVQARCGVLLPDGMNPSLRVVVDVFITLRPNTTSDVTGDDHAGTDAPHAPGSPCANCAMSSAPNSKSRRPTYHRPCFRLS